MGLPAMNVIFTERAVESIKRSDRGVIGMIVKDAVPDGNPVTIRKVSEIPETLAETTKEQIELALKGYISAPSKIVLYVLESEAENYEEALAHFSVHKVNWLVCPTAATDTQTEAVATWVKEQRNERNKVKAVLPEVTGDNEGIVNYATKSASIGDKTYTAEQFCSRIAGMLAGTPIKQGVTFAALEDVTDCEKKSRNQLSTEIDAGKMLLYYDGEKVKIARGVNSLTTLADGKSDSWKKIAVVETMDMIYDDLILLAEENYIGKYRNNFDNKCLLLSAINSYLAEVSRTGAIQDYSLGFDYDAIREYIVTKKGVPRDEADAMADAEVQKQYTDEKVFMKASMTIVDIMEEITLKITV